MSKASDFLDEAKLIGSGPSLERLLDQLSKNYFYSEITAKKVSEKEWEVHNSKGLIKGFRIIQKKNRFRFEHIGD